MKKVLVVEDDLVTASFIKKAVEYLGHKVIAETDTALDALQLIDALNPNVVLLDININGYIDGITAAELMKRREDIQIIFITGNINNYTLNRAMNIDGAAILNKQIVKGNYADYLKEIIA